MLKNSRNRARYHTAIHAPRLPRRQRDAILSTIAHRACVDVRAAMGRVIDSEVMVMKSSKRILLGLSLVVMMLSLASLPVAYAAAMCFSASLRFSASFFITSAGDWLFGAAAVEVARKMTAD